MKLIDALVTSLRDWGIEYVFGVSGANIEHLHDAIHRLGDDRIQAVLTKSEVGAAFMADGRARVHRTLGVCCSTSGGGMMNLAVGIAESYAESVPVLALVGQTASMFDGRGGFQDSSGIGRTVNALNLWQSMSKYAARVDDPSGFWEHLQTAVEQALTGRPGPAVLLFPRDIYDLEVGERPADFPTSLEELTRSEPVGDQLGLIRILETLRHAKNPVMMIGTGAARSRRPQEVASFAIEAGIPVVTTMGNTAAFPHEHPLFLGTVGVAGHPSAHAYLNEEADVIVAVGTGLNVLTRGPLGPALDRAKLAVINLDPGEATRAADVNIVLRADAGAAFEELRAMHRREPFFHGAPKRYDLQRFVPKLAPVPAPTHEERSDVLLQSEAINIVEGFLPEEGHVLFDAGNCAATAMHHLNIPPKATTTIALGMGGMGYAIAAATGAQIGQKGRTMVLCGDGAFLMLGLEVHTAVEQGLPILFVVFNNMKHGMCVTRQQIFFDGRLEATSYDQLNVAGIARGLGGEQSLWVGRATTPAQLQEQLENYTREHSHGPGVLELVLPVEEIPPFTPFLDQGAETFVVPTRNREMPDLAVQPAA